MPTPTIPIQRYPAKVTILASLLLSAIVLGVMFRLFTPQAPPIPENLPVLIPTPPFTKTELTINWRTTDHPKVKQLPLYNHPTNAISPALADQLAAQLGFTSKHKVDTKTADRLYVNGAQSLTVNLPSGPLVFVDSSALSPIKSGFNYTDLDSRVTDKVNSLLKLNRPVSILGSPQYFANGQPSTPQLAQVVRYNLTVLINDTPLIAPSSSSAPISITLDNNLNLVNLIIHGLYLPQEDSRQVNLFSFDQLKAVTPVAAQKLPNSDTTELESQFETASNVLLNVDSIALAYIYAEASQQLLPAFLLKGTAAPMGLQTTPVDYVVPASAN